MPQYPLYGPPISAQLVDGDGFTVDAVHPLQTALAVTINQSTIGSIHGVDLNGDPISIDKPLLIGADDGSGNASDCQVDGSHNLKVNVAVSVLPTGAATEATLSNIDNNLSQMADGVDIIRIPDLDDTPVNLGFSSFNYFMGYNPNNATVFVQLYTAPDPIPGTTVPFMTFPLGANGGGYDLTSQRIIFDGNLSVWASAALDGSGSPAGSVLIQVGTLD